jgi:hypothetical protein
MTLTDLGTLIIALATTASLLYISRQVSATRQQAKGQFLLALDAQLEKSYPIARRLLNEQTFKPVGDDWPDVWRLMSLFERINIMVEDRILDLGIVDRLYGFLLVGIIANDDIYERLASTGAEWQDFIDLCYAIADYRERRGPDKGDTAFIERVRKLDKQSRRLQNPWRY